MDIFEKIAYIMCWDLTNVDAKTAFMIECDKGTLLPRQEVVDIAYYGSLEEWANEQDVESQEELFQLLKTTCAKIVTDTAFQDKKTAQAFPPIYNHYSYVNSSQKRGRLYNDLLSIAETAYNGHIAQRRLKKNCDKIFGVKYNEDTYKKACAKMRLVWGFMETDIDALRYFICQAKSLGTNSPSLNKALYFWSTEKKTGKTTFARAISASLNGDTFFNAGKYESTYATECQYNVHDLPRACVYNCVVLDEAMPKDTKKSYGTLKQMITSNSVTYNPKYRQLVVLPARRNYIFTSNDEIVRYIQDESERRFYAIEFKSSPKQMTFDEIYTLVRTFVEQCKPREDLSLQQWYDSFADIDGMDKREKNYLLQDMVRDKDIIFTQKNCNARSVAKMLFRGEPSRENIEQVRDIMKEYFSSCSYPCNKYLYSCSQIKAILCDLDEDRKGLEYEEESSPF